MKTEYTTKEIRCEECRYYKTCLWGMVNKMERRRCFEPKPKPWWSRIIDAFREWAMEE